MAFYVIGFPGETLAEVKATIEFALDRYRRFGVRPLMHLAKPLPGTPLLEMAEQIHYNGAEHAFGANTITTDEFDPEIIAQLFRDFTRRKYLIFAKRTLTNRADFLYNLEFLWNDRHNKIRNIRKVLSAPQPGRKQAASRETGPASKEWRA